MSHESCVSLLEVTEAEQKEAMDQLNAFAKEISKQKLYQARQALIKAAWQMKIATDERRAMENVNREFTLCKRCVVERPEEKIPESDRQ